MGVKWTEDQRKAIDSRNGTLLVSAAAGSGKTAVLVERLLKFVMDEGRDIDKFLMITYTNAASAQSCADQRRRTGWMDGRCHLLGETDAGCIGTRMDSI